MKKQLLSRVRGRYLYKRFPENLDPKKPFKKSGKQSWVAEQLPTPSARSTTLSAQLKRGERGIHERKLALNYSPQLQIESLERGSLAPSLDIGNSHTPYPSPMGHGRSNVWLEDERDPTCLLVNPVVRQSDDRGWRSNEWRLKTNHAKARSLGEKPKEGKDFVSNPSSIITRKRKKGVSLYSFSQLEGTLSRQQEKRSSSLLLHLMEKKKLRIMYGNLSNRETISIIRRAAKGRGRFSDILFRLLESRLDVVVFRIGFFPTIPFARQWIYHGKVLVNSQVMTFANYLLQPGDIISIVGTNKQLLKKQIEGRTDSFSILLRRGPQSQIEVERGAGDLLSLEKADWRIFPWSKGCDPVTYRRRVKEMGYTSTDVESCSRAVVERLPSASKGVALETQGMGWRVIPGHQGGQTHRGSKIIRAQQAKTHLGWVTGRGSYFLGETDKWSLKKTTTARPEERRRGDRQNKTEAGNFKGTPLTLRKIVKKVMTAPLMVKGLKAATNQAGSGLIGTHCREDKENHRLTEWQFREELLGKKLRKFPLKVTHIETSFHLLTAIYLYHSQRVVFPATIDTEKILSL